MVSQEELLKASLHFFTFSIYTLYWWECLRTL